MKCSAIITTDSGRWALDEDELRRLVYLSSTGLNVELKRLQADGKKASAELIEFGDLLSFLRNADQD